MRQKTKKLLSVVLSLSMALSVMPLTAYAAEGESGGESASAPVLSLTSEANSTTTSGAAFDISTTTDGAVKLTLPAPVDNGTSNAAFSMDFESKGTTYDEQQKNAIKNGVQVIIPVSLVKEDYGMTVDALLASFTFNPDAVDTMRSAENVILSVTGYDTAPTGVSNSAYAIDLSLTDEDGTNLFTEDTAEGSVTVTVPVGMVSTKFSNDDYLSNAVAYGVEIYYVGDDGLTHVDTYPALSGNIENIDGNDYVVEFTTNHFSTYVMNVKQALIFDETPSELDENNNMSLEVDDEVTIEVSTMAEDGVESYDYTLSGTGVTVEQNGNLFTVTATEVGRATLTITAKGQNGFEDATDTIIISVTESTTTPAAFSIELSSESGSVKRGREFDVAEQISNKDALEEAGVTLTYTSANTSKVTVNATTGIATGVAVTTEPIDITIKGTGTDGATTSAVFALTVTRSSNGEDSSSSSSGGGGGGSSSSGYSVNVSSASNGTVSVDKDRASSGSTVTITAEPDEGYVVGSVTVTDSDGNEITVRDRGNNEYTFTMPSSRVTIEVEFVEDTTVEEPVDEITEADFSDVSSSDWFYDAVNYVFSKGIMVGVTENSFAPNSSLTRAMIVQMLYSLEGSPEVTGTAPFTDVAIGQWYTNAITWAASNNIVSGMGDGTFAPNNNITREQLAMILYNYAQLKGNAVTASGNLAAFTDGNEVSDWAETAVRWAVGEGLMSGKGNGVLDPVGTTTRAEAASMFMRFMESDLA